MFPTRGLKHFIHNPYLQSKDVVELCVFKYFHTNWLSPCNWRRIIRLIFPSMMDVSTTNIAHKFMNDITSLSGSSNNLYGEIVEYLSSEKGVCVLLNLQKINPQVK